MQHSPICLLGALLLCLLVASQSSAQEEAERSITPSKTFRPVVRGTQYAVSSMKQEATRAAARILESGGNAFDAIVAGQAVLALVNPESNGLGADAVILVYHAGEKKVYSINEDLGIIGFGFGVEWCVGGLDRNDAYAPNCKMARP